MLLPSSADLKTLHRPCKTHDFCLCGGSGLAEIFSCFWTKLKPKHLSLCPLQNRMHESLALFSTTIHSVWFQYTSIILFLNKTDILADKIRTSDLNKCFPSFSGDLLFNSTISFQTVLVFKKSQNVCGASLFLHEFQRIAVLLLEF